MRRASAKPSMLPAPLGFRQDDIDLSVRTQHGQHIVGARALDDLVAAFPQIVGYDHAREDIGVDHEDHTRGMVAGARLGQFCIHGRSERMSKAMGSACGGHRSPQPTISGHLQRRELPVTATR